MRLDIKIWSRTPTFSTLPGHFIQPAHHHALPPAFSLPNYYWLREKCREGRTRKSLSGELAGPEFGSDPIQTNALVHTYTTRSLCGTITISCANTCLQQHGGGAEDFIFRKLNRRPRLLSILSFPERENVR